MEPSNGSEFIAMISALLRDYGGLLSTDSQKILDRIAYMLLTNVYPNHDDTILDIAKGVATYKTFLQSCDELEQIKQQELQGAIDHKEQIEQIIGEVNSFLGTLSNALCNNIVTYNHDKNPVNNPTDQEVHHKANEILNINNKATQTTLWKLPTIPIMTKLILDFEKKDNVQLRTELGWDAENCSILRDQFKFIKGATSDDDHSMVFHEICIYCPSYEDYNQAMTSGTEDIKQKELFYSEISEKLKDFINETESLFYGIMQNLLNISATKNNEQVQDREIISDKDGTNNNEIFIPSLTPSLLYKTDYSKIARMNHTLSPFEIPVYANPAILQFADAFMEQCRIKSTDYHVQYLLRLSDLLDMSKKLLKLHDKNELAFKQLIQPFTINTKQLNIVDLSDALNKLEAKEEPFELNLSRIVGHNYTDDNSNIDDSYSMLGMDSMNDLNANQSLNLTSEHEQKQENVLTKNHIITPNTNLQLSSTNANKQTQQDEYDFFFDEISKNSVKNTDSRKTPDLQELKSRRMQAFLTSLFCLFAFDALLYLTLNYKVPVYAYVALGGLFLAFCIFAYIGYDANKKIISIIPNDKIIENEITMLYKVLKKYNALIDINSQELLDSIGFILAITSDADHDNIIQGIFKKTSGYDNFLKNYEKLQQIEQQKKLQNPIKEVVKKMRPFLQNLSERLNKYIDKIEPKLVEILNVLLSIKDRSGNYASIKNLASKELTDKRIYVASLTHKEYFQYFLNCQKSNDCALIYLSAVKCLSNNLSTISNKVLEFAKYFMQQCKMMPSETIGDYKKRLKFLKKIADIISVLSSKRIISNLTSYLYMNNIPYNLSTLKSCEKIYTDLKKISDNPNDYLQSIENSKATTKVSRIEKNPIRLEMVAAENTQYERYYKNDTVVKPIKIIEIPSNEMNDNEMNESNTDKFN